MPITDLDLKNWFTYHAPSETPPVPVPLALTGGEYRQIDAASAYQYIRDAGLIFARVVLANTPVSADQSAAIRKIREAVMTANAAVACGGK